MESKLSWVTLRTNDPLSQLAFEFLTSTLGLQTSGPPGSALAIDDLVPEALRRIGEVIDRPLSSARRDDHGRFRPEGILHQPVADAWAQEVLETIRHAFQERMSPLVRKWPWRHGRPLGVALSHDVDLHLKWRAKTVISYAFRRRDLAGIAAKLRHTPDPWWSFDRIMDVERKAGVKSTFFLAAGGSHREDPTYRIENPRIRSLVRDLHAEAWEIGLHGSYRASENGRLLEQEKQRFERATGQVVDTYRQHYLRFHRDSPGRIRGAGFRYDSSLGTEYSLGFLGGASVPYRIDSLWELPVSLMDTCFQPQSDVNRAYVTEAARVSAIREVLGNVRAVNGLAVVDWHQNYFDEGTYPGFQRLYETILGETADADRGGVRDIARWWETRQDAQMSQTRNLGKIAGTSLPAGFTIAVTGGTLRTDTPVTERRGRGETLYSFETPGPWEFSVE